MYAIGAWFYSNQAAKNDPVKQRLASLEQALASGDRSQVSVGSLYALLAGQPDAARAIVQGWDEERLVHHLGWPETLGQTASGERLWWYLPRQEGAKVLQIQWSPSQLVQALTWIDKLPK